MNELLIGVVCVVFGLAWAELREWLPWIARKVMTKAVLFLPVDDRGRMQEELLAELAVVPGKLSPLGFACDIWRGYWWSAVAGPLEAAATRVAIRILDIVLASGILILTAPTMVLTFLVTSLSTRTFGLQRIACVGRSRAPFRYLSFHLYHSQTGQLTRTSHLVCRLSFASLPALFNVLSGHMSLVGPFPTRALPPNCRLAHLKPGLIWCRLRSNSPPIEKYGKSFSPTLKMYFCHSIESMRLAFFR